MRITQLRILTLILMCVGSLCIVISLATNQWYTIIIKSSFTSKETEVSYGLFKNCTNGDCKTIETREGKIKTQSAAPVQTYLLPMILPLNVSYNELTLVPGNALDHSG